MNQEQFRANLLSTTFWGRILFMALFGLALWALWLVLIVICVVQTVIVLITGEINEQLKSWGAMATEYLAEIVAFMLFTTEEKPFPFAPFPTQSPKPAGSAAKASTEAPETAAKSEKAEPAKQDKEIPVLKESASEDDNDDSFYDPNRDSDATR